MKHDFLRQWKRQLEQPSGNLTTNERMPSALITKLLEEDVALADAIRFTEIRFPKLRGSLASVRGLQNLAGLQRSTKPGNLTFFRAVRFPTYKRIAEVLGSTGYAISNYEQERILELYRRKTYIQKRQSLKKDPLFWTQPQERVVPGLPLFHLANDALQIHRAFRGKKDRVLLLAIHVPHTLLETGRIKLTANAAIDLEYTDATRDVPVTKFKKEKDILTIDEDTLRAQGVDLHEMYSHDLPMNRKGAEALGISQDVFLLEIERFSMPNMKRTLLKDVEVLKRNAFFIHGFFGDQTIFGRRASEYLPTRCWRVQANKNRAL